MNEIRFQKSCVKSVAGVAIILAAQFCVFSQQECTTILAGVNEYGVSFGCNTVYTKDELIPEGEGGIQRYSIQEKSGSIRVQDLKSIMRSHYEGTDDYHYPPYETDIRGPICVSNTKAAQVWHLQSDQNTREKYLTEQAAKTGKKSLAKYREGDTEKAHGLLSNFTFNMLRMVYNEAKALLDELQRNQDKECNYEKERIVSKYKNREPEKWGERVPDVVTGIDTEEKIVFLTLDGCGGEEKGYDEDLIEFLKEKEIPATVFLSGIWIKENKEAFARLANNPLFTIGNHGTAHKPLSTTGKEAYGIKGTGSPGEVVQEILCNSFKIEKLTGEKPEFFRSGTAHYDEISVEIAKDLGKKVIGFGISGDGGAEYSKEEVKRAFLNVEPGSIILAHMNQPASETKKGIKEVIPRLKEKGYRFVHLEEYKDQFIYQK